MMQVGWVFFQTWLLMPESLVANIELLAQAALRVPSEVEFAMLSWPVAIVITNFRSSSFFSFFRLLLLTDFGETPVCENLFPPIFCHI